MGDIVGLVEKAAQTVNAEDAAKMAKKLKKGSFDLDDLRGQLLQMKKMGGMGALMGMMPGMGQMKKALAGANLDEKVFDRQIAVINSMTKAERANPDVLNAKRRIRIANGSGTKVEDVNKMLKMHRNMADVMKAMSGGPKRGPMAGLANMLGFGGGGGMPSPEQLQELQKRMPGGAPDLPPGAPGGGPPGTAPAGGPPGPKRNAPCARNCFRSRNCFLNCFLNWLNFFCCCATNAASSAITMLPLGAPVMTRTWSPGLRSLSFADWLLRMTLALPPTSIGTSSL
jgi:hypothetical protein